MEASFKKSNSFVKATETNFKAINISKLDALTQKGSF